jgi:hypothetical protein
MAAHRKYFTEEERLEARRRTSRRSYFRSRAYVPVSQPKRTKQAERGRRQYWTKKAIAQGLPAESWKLLYARHRNALKNRRGYWRPDRLEKARNSAKENWEKHRNDPEYKARKNESVMRWRNNHPERVKSIVLRWYRNNRDKVLDRQRAAYEREKREDRARLVLAIGGQ